MKDFLGFIILLGFLFVWIGLLIGGLVTTLELCILGGAYFIGAVLVGALTGWLIYAGCYVLSGGRI